MDVTLSRSSNTLTLHSAGPTLRTSLNAELVYFDGTSLFSTRPILLSVQVARLASSQDYEQMKGKLAFPSEIVVTNRSLEIQHLWLSFCIDNFKINRNVVRMVPQKFNFFLRLKNCFLCKIHQFPAKILFVWKVDYADAVILIKKM
jgi:hypothetical protein